MIGSDPTLASLTSRSQGAWLIGSVVASRVAFFVGLVVAVSWEAHTLFSPAIRIRAAGQKPFVVTDFGRGVPVGQTFRMLSDGLDAVDVRFFSDEETLLSVRCRLLGWTDDLPEHWSPLSDRTAMVRLPRGSSWQRFAFSPVVPSINRVYQFQVEQIDARVARPRNPGERPSVGVMGSIDDSLESGNLVVGRTQVTDRDLFFEAHAADSVFAEFRRQANPPLPKLLRSAVLQLTVLAVYNGALAVFVFHMLIPPPTPGHDEES
jgi:hypothetical protein